MVWLAVARGGSVDGRLERCQLVNSADVRSVQCLELPDVPGAFEVWGSAHNLEYLLHSYFAVAARSVWPLVGVRWRARRPTLMIARLIPLIVMGTASVGSTAERREISVTVEGGILVKVASDARLTLSLERRQPLVCAKIELVGYYPRFGHRAFVRWVYAASQARLHVWVGRRFLRQLQRTWTGGLTPPVQT
ncbi:MAG TPA: hypothetical protein VIU62_23980 [Chloroflexota bacterium]